MKLIVKDQVESTRIITKIAEIREYFKPLLIKSSTKDFNRLFRMDDFLADILHSVEVKN